MALKRYEDEWRAVNEFESEDAFARIVSKSRARQVRVTRDIYRVTRVQCGLSLYKYT